MKRIVKLIAGWAFIVLGVAGLFLPVLPGLVFLLVGLTILSTEHRWARRLMIRLRRRFPKASRELRRFLQKYSPAA